METLDNFPVKFGSDHDECLDYDQRTFCQLAQQDDPLYFVFNASVIGDELLFCTSLDDDCCFTPGGGDTGCDETDQYWQFNTGGFYSGGWTIGDGQVCNNDGGDMWQENVLTTIGTYKVVVTVPGYPDNVGNTGTFRVQLGDAFSSAISSAAGTYTVYLEVTSIATFNGIKIIPSDGSIFCISSVSLKQMCADHTIMIKDEDGDVVASFDQDSVPSGGSMFLLEGQVHVLLLWSYLGLANGCYYICISSGCDGLVENGTFDEDRDGDGDVDVSDFLIDWTPSNANAVWSSGSVCHTGSSTTLTQSISLGANTTYVLSYTLTINTSDTNYISISVGGVQVDLRTALEGAGTFHVFFTTNSSPTGTVVVEFGGGFDGCLTYIDIKTPSCTGCYNLATTHSCTKLLKWRNDDDAFGINYTAFQAVWHHMRVNAVLKTPSYPQEQEDYVDSGGTGSMLYFSSRKAKELFIDDIPEYMHDAIAIGKGHDEFFIDGVEYICEKAYEPEWDEVPLLKTAKSRFLVYKKTQNNKNKLC